MKKETLKKANEIQAEIDILNELLHDLNIGEIDYINVYIKDSKFYTTIDKNFIITDMVHKGKLEIVDDIMRLKKQLEEL